MIHKSFLSKKARGGKALIKKKTRDAFRKMRKHVMHYMFKKASLLLEGKVLATQEW